MNRAPYQRAALLLALTCLLACCGKKGKWVEVDTGYRGEARHNPFLAAEKLLEAHSRQAGTSYSLSDIRTQGPALIIAPAASIDDRASVTLLRQEVASGTHLCLLLEDGETWFNDWLGDPNKNEYRLADKGALYEWMTELGVQINELEYPQGEVETMLEDWVYQLDQPTRQELSLKQGFDEGLSSNLLEGGPGPLITRSWFEGRVTVLASASPWRNPRLAENDHAALLLDLSEYYTPLAGPALILLRSDVSLWELLWQHGWPALLGAALTLILFLWWHMPRREPIRAQLEAGDRATFRDQIIGTGNYLWQRGSPETLLGAMRRLAVQRWRARHPLRMLDTETAKDLALEKLESLSFHEIQSLSSWLGEDPAVVQAALVDPAPSKPRELETRIIRLQHILAALG